ncbi:hypothetical protein [Variovorax sp. GT1P44]|uniref:hypothetical protein n=1 Tax=Variovorax sp. GT1P44 TaxID=3443742 RepID=UPI003F488121
MTLEVLCQRSAWSDSIEILFCDKSGRKPALARPLVFEVPEDLGLITEPTVRLENQSAQRLIDELWRAGLRPTEGSGSAGSLRATERHLEDMRKLALDLVAHKLGSAA